MFSKAYNCFEFTPESVVSPGEKALVCLHKGKLTDNLESLPYNILCQKVTSSELYIKVRSSTTYISSCQIPLPPGILPGEVVDGRLHESIWMGLDNIQYPNATKIHRSWLRTRWARHYLYSCLWSMPWYKKWKVRASRYWTKYQKICWFLMLTRSANFAILWFA